MSVFLNICIVRRFTEYALRTKDGLGVLSLYGAIAENGFRAFHRPKMSSQDTQAHTISCIFRPNIKLNSLRPYPCGSRAL